MASGGIVGGLVVEDAPGSRTVDTRFNPPVTNTKNFNFRVVNLKEEEIRKIFQEELSKNVVATANATAAHYHSVYSKARGI